MYIVKCFTILCGYFLEVQNIIELFSVLHIIKRTVSSSQPASYMINSIMSERSYEYITHSYSFRMST